MKRSRFTQEQIIGVLKEHQAGAAAPELCRKHGIGEATSCKGRSGHGGREASDAKRLRGLEEGNARLKKLLAGSVLDVSRCGRCWQELLTPQPQTLRVPASLRRSAVTSPKRAAFAAGSGAGWTGSSSGAAAAQR